ncbi:hypothetical protein ACR784_05985 [Sphingobacterium multivorum]|uniref:Uncharacterized protein n=1 Tax=Sphingobacterium thalpophilum TaxID=259 RepID=A0ACD5C9C4_9SPHI
MAENNLNNKEALEKLKGIVHQIDVGTVCSFPSDSDYPHGVPMSRQEVDANGDIWYICSAESETFKNNFTGSQSFPILCRSQNLHLFEYKR